MGKRLDLIGKKYGKLTVISFSHIDKGSNSCWLCKCDCGNEKILAGRNFTKGETTSCGCVHKEYMEIHNAKINGLTKLPYGEACFNVIFRRYERNASTRKLTFALSKEIFKEIITKPCHYCGQEPNVIQSMKGCNGDFTYNGIDRKNNKEGYLIENCLPCCSDCNWLKGSDDYDKFIERVHKISAHRRNNEQR